ncbi:hypothetical protein AURDEDRAFT_168046 [Auricularia subglabra TFB-10046 SS5]|nr:hypothetical protein AURDEDRAFT_168046 [Auricularia subglabra TFB-10046 SS5]
MQDAPSHSQSQHFSSIVEEHDTLVSSVLRLGTLANDPSGPQITAFDVSLLINAVDDLLIRAQQASPIFPPFELANLRVSCLEMKHFLHQLPCSPAGPSSNAPYYQAPLPVLPSSVLHPAFSAPARTPDLFPAPAAHAPMASFLLSPYGVVLYCCLVHPHSLCISLLPLLSVDPVAPLALPVHPLPSPASPLWRRLYTAPDPSRPSI